MELSIFKDGERHLAGPRCQLGMPEAAQVQGNPEPPTERAPLRVLGANGPEPLWHQGLVSWKTIIPWTGVWGGDFRVTRAHCLLCTLLLLYQIIKHQIPEVVGPCSA